MMDITVVYCYDAYCNWCFGFSPILKKLFAKFGGSLSFEVLSGGMILPSKPVHIAATAEYFLKTYQLVEATTGVKFGDDYLWHIKNSNESDWYPNSEKPAIALCIFKEYFPDNQIEFASALQFALFYEGRDLCDDEAYRHLLQHYGIPDKVFYEKLHAEEYRDKAYEEFALVKQLKTSGFPALLMQSSESKFYLVANGYSDYDTITQRINKIIEDIRNQ